MLQKIFHIFLEAFFPVTCVVCDTGSEWLCADCLNAVILKPRIICHQCHKEVDSLYAECCEGDLGNVFIGMDYDQLHVEKIITAFKYESIQELSKPLTLLVQKSLAQSQFRFREEFAVIPVPLHRKRLVERGFNQSAVLAHAIFQHSGSLVLSDIVKRVRNTKKQAHLSREQRLENLKKAFKIDDNVPENVLLVDDVYTTGSTLEVLAKTLKLSGSKQVHAVVVASNAKEKRLK